MGVLISSSVSENMCSDISLRYRAYENNRPPLRGVRLFLLKAGDSENLGVRLVFSKNLPKSWGAVIFLKNLLKSGCGYFKNFRLRRKNTVYTPKNSILCSFFSPAAQKSLEILGCGYLMGCGYFFVILGSRKFWGAVSFLGKSSEMGGVRFFDGGRLFSPPR